MIWMVMSVLYVMLGGHLWKAKCCKIQETPDQGFKTPDQGFFSARAIVSVCASRKKPLIRGFSLLVQ